MPLRSRKAILQPTLVYQISLGECKCPEVHDNRIHMEADVLEDASSDHQQVTYHCSAVA